MKNVINYDEFIGKKSAVNESRYETGRHDKYHNPEYIWKNIFDDLKKVVLGRKKMTKPLYQALCHFTIAHYNMWGWIDHYNGNWGELANEIYPHRYGEYDAPDRAPFDDIQKFLIQHDRDVIKSPYESVSNGNKTVVNEGLINIIKMKSQITKVQGAVLDKAVELYSKNKDKYKDIRQLLREIENEAKSLYKKTVTVEDAITPNEWWSDFSKSLENFIKNQE